MSQIKITQRRSGIGRNADQQRTLTALGLRGIGKSVIQKDEPSIRGMAFKVRHLVEVEEVKDSK